ncbi:MAG: YeeE/YedE family protein [Pseudomonadota bacterium]|nr:YeeE/YedE family protein [Pseudomonadota bacterium]
MKDPAVLANLVTGLAFALAFAFGAVAHRVSFCTMGAVTDVVNFGDWRRMRMWILAIAIAMLGTAALQAYGLIDTGKSIYTAAKVPWLSHVVGGFLFGFGMTLASGCGSKTLIRAGAGNLKSLIVLVFLAAAAYMTLKGVFAPWRANGLDTVRWDVGAKASDLPTLAMAAGFASAVRVWLPLVVAGALLVFIFMNRDFRTTPELIIGGLVVGAVIVGGWYVSGHLGYLPEDPQTLEEKFVATNSGHLESFSFVAPSAYLLELLLLWTDQSRVITFGIAGVLGMLLGSAAMALSTRTFRWEGFASVEDTTNHVVGGVLMGFGGVTALGCTIGQGLAGVSTLAVGSILTLACIIAGCVVAVKYQMWRIERMDAVPSVHVDASRGPGIVSDWRAAPVHSELRHR